MPPHQRSSHEAELHWSVESTRSAAEKESCRLEFHLKLRQSVETTEKRDSWTVNRAEWFHRNWQACCGYGYSWIYPWIFLRHLIWIVTSLILIFACHTVQRDVTLENCTGMGKGELGIIVIHIYHCYFAVMGTDFVVTLWGWGPNSRWILGTGTRVAVVAYRGIDFIFCNHGIQSWTGL